MNEAKPPKEVSCRIFAFFPCSSSIKFRAYIAIDVWFSRSLSRSQVLSLFPSHSLSLSAILFLRFYEIAKVNEYMHRLFQCTLNQDFISLVFLYFSKLCLAYCSLPFVIFQYTIYLYSVSKNISTYKTENLNEKRFGARIRKRLFSMYLMLEIKLSISLIF